MKIRILPVVILTNRLLMIAACFLYLTNTRTNASGQVVDAIVAQGHAEVVVGDGLVQYGAGISVVLSKDGRFVFHIFNHPHYSDREIVFSYDGTDYFYVIPEDPRGYAYLSSDTEGPPMILFQDDVRDALWMAIGAANFIEQNGPTGEMVNLFARPRQSVAAYGFRYEADLIKQQFPITRRFSIYRDGSLDLRDREEELRLGLDLSNFGRSIRMDQWQSRRAWTDGSLAVDVVWNQEEKITAGITVPMTVKVTAYRSRQPDPANPPIFREVTVRFESWRREALANPSFRPEIRQALDVMDSRLRRRAGSNYVDEVGYLVGDPRGDRSWRAKDDPVIQARFEERLKLQPLPTAVGNRNYIRFVLIIIALIAVCLPIVLYIRIRSNERHE